MGELIKNAPDIYEAVKDPVKLSQAKAAYLDRAGQIGDKRLIQSIFSAIEKKRKEQAKSAMANRNRSESEVYIETGPNGAPLETIGNFLSIMLHDERYKNIRYNLVSNQAEVLRVDSDGV